MDLKDFSRNDYLREEVRNFVIAFLKEEAVTRTFAGQDVEHIKEAKLVIDKAFNFMKKQNEKPKTKKLQSVR